MATYIKLMTWRRKPSMAKTKTVFTFIPKGLIISSQSTSNWSVLPYRLHLTFPTNLWVKRNKQFTLEQHQSLYVPKLTASVHVHVYHVSSSVSKVLLRNTIDQWKIISEWWNFCDKEYFDCISEAMKYVAPSLQACKPINHMIPELDLKS